jgi:dephospho-CoA kinase
MKNSKKKEILTSIQALTPPPTSGFFTDLKKYTSMIIIGITGTNGAGKGELAQFLKNTYGFAHYQVREFLTQEILERGLQPDRPTMSMIANELRKKHAPEYIIHRLRKQAFQEQKNAIIESVRNEGEIAFLKAQGALIRAVDADQKVRYQRVTERKSSTDNITFSEFKKQESLEFKNKDPHKQNLKQCIQLADHVFVNNGSREELFKQIKQQMKKIR